MPAATTDRVALVLSGGGARGAYEVGVLSALAPALAAAGQTPDIVVGTSIGALNGAFVASRADEPFEEVVGELLATWRGLGFTDVLGPLVSAKGLGRALGAALTFAGLPGPRLESLIDTAPLRASIERLIDFERLERNVAGGALTAAAVTATAFATGGSVVFHHGGPEVPPDPVRGIDYAATPLAAEHVAASSAIPGAFEAVRVHRPAGAAGWYADGGLRLNTPLKPALKLGADRVVVVGLNATAPTDAPASRPDAVDGLALLAQVALADQVADDVATLAARNDLVTGGGSAEAGKRARPDPPTGGRTVPYIFVAPADSQTIGRIAHDIYVRHYSGVGGLLRDRNVALLGRAVGAERSALHGELLSYLFVAREFIDALIELGRADGERWLAAVHDQDLWQLGR